MEQVPVFEERETTYVTTERGAGCRLSGILKKESIRILVENETDWSVENRRGRRNVPCSDQDKPPLSVNGKEVPYNQYLVLHGSCCGCRSRHSGRNRSWQFCTVCPSGLSWAEPDSPGWWNRRKNRFRFWNGRSGSRCALPKHISQSSYENVNTYGSVHNDPVTSFLGLFGKNGSDRRPESF